MVSVTRNFTLADMGNRLFDSQMGEYLGFVEFMDTRGSSPRYITDQNIVIHEHEIDMGAVQIGLRQH